MWALLSADIRTLILLHCEKLTVEVMVFGLGPTRRVDLKPDDSWPGPVRVTLLNWWACDPTGSKPTRTSFFFKKKKLLNV